MPKIKEPKDLRFMSQFFDCLVEEEGSSYTDSPAKIELRFRVPAIFFAMSQFGGYLFPHSERKKREVRDHSMRRAISHMTEMIERDLWSAYEKAVKAKEEEEKLPR